MHALAWLPALAPLALAAVAALAHGERGRPPRRVLAAASAAALLTLALAHLTALAVIARGPLESALIGAGGLGLALRLDPLSATMFWLVAVVGAVIVRFSRHYLAGDARHGLFVGRLCLTLAAVLMLVLAGNLAQLALGWIGTSLALHGLLVFYGERPRAVAAARKKFVVARTADACLVAAVALLAHAFGTADVGALAAAARAAGAAGELPAGVGLATLLVVAAAALKSAVFPIHGWLVEVMETPTPVSALLHAGLVNAGGFVLVRLGEVVVLSAPALVVLVVIGGVTALVASAAMVAQPSVKVSLAYSSAAQMGFMLMLCGLGAHAAAILHLVGHSFYKAHAFLSAGSAVEYAAATGSHADEPDVGPLGLGAAVALALALFIGIGTALGVPLAERPGAMALGAIFVMGLAHLVARGLAGAPAAAVLARTALAATAVTVAFFGLEAGAAHLLAGTVATAPAPGAATLAVIALTVLAFGGVSIAQTLRPARVSSPLWCAAWVHLKHGFYANALFDRLLGLGR